MIRKLSLTTFLFASTLSLSGCSQEAAPETLKTGSDYSYLSEAIRSETTTLPRGSSSDPTIPAIPQTPNVAGERAESTPPSPAETAPVPAPNESKPKEPEPKKETPETDKKDTESDFLEKYDGAILKTSEGDITIRFYNSDAPKTVENFFTLAAKNFYDGIRFHRVIKGFIIQAGDPNSRDDNRSDDGQGGPGYTFADEINSKKLVEGSVAMANSGPNTNGSQFFIVTAKSTPLLDGRYTNFGEVIDGMDIVRKIEKVDTDANDHPKENIEIKSVKFVKKK